MFQPWLSVYRCLEWPLQSEHPCWSQFCDRPNAHHSWFHCTFRWILFLIHGSWSQSDSTPSSLQVLLNYLCWFSLKGDISKLKSAYLNWTYWNASLLLPCLICVSCSPMADLLRNWRSLLSRMWFENNWLSYIRLSFRINGRTERQEEVL